MKTLSMARLTEILPDSLLRDERIKALAEGVDTELEKLTVAAKQVLHLPRIDELSGTILDLLAWQFHVDHYEPLWLDDATKRNLIRQSIKTHRLKGTRYAVDAVNAAFNRKVEIAEWYEYGGEPFHFRLSVAPFKSNSDLQTWLRQINEVKNVRSWVDVRFERQIEMTLYVGIARWLHGRITRQMTSSYDVGRATTTLIDGERTLIISATQVIIRYGDQEEVIPLGNLFGDQLKMRFNFPAGERILTLDNPREDLTAEEVQEVADYVAENEILLDAAGETTSELTRATIYTTTVQVLF